MSSAGRTRRPDALSTSRAARDDTPLTPRTPHSRAGRAEEGFTQIELDTFGDDEYKDYAQHQREPLLRSSNSDTFPTGYHAGCDDDDGKAPAGALGKMLLALDFARQRLGLITGCVAAAFLLVLIYFALRRPDELAEYIGDTHTTNASPSPASAEDLESAPTIPPNVDPADIISYVNYSRFPLAPDEYRTECAKLTHDFEPSGGYWEAQGKQDVLHNDAGKEGSEICSRSITYMLDGHVGLLADLALIVQAAGIAREFSKTFLIDDTYWSRGKWTDHFEDVRTLEPGPEPGCRAPPPEELVACPRSARHWVINSRTAKYHFGPSYHDAFDNPYKQGMDRAKPIFDRAARSFNIVVRPNARTDELIRYTRAELTSMLPEPSAPLTSYVATHIRRGDRNGVSWFFHKAPVPITEHATAIVDAWARLKPDANQSAPVVYAASDDPDAFDELRALLPVGTVMLDLLDSAVPKLREVASGEAYIQAEFDTLDEDARRRRTTGTIVDFALLSGMWHEEGDVSPVAVACGIASNVCKMSAVGLGWEHAFGDMSDRGMIDAATAGWLDVDQKGSIVPQWEAYEMFN